MTKSNVEGFVEDGFRIGDYVILSKRITIKYGKKEDRKDIAEGTKAAIKGFVAPDGLILEFNVVPGKGKPVTVEWNVSKKNVKLPSAVDAEAKPSAVKKELAFLVNEPKCEADSVVEFEDWSKRLLVNDDFAASHKMKNKVAFALDCLVSKLPKYNDSDFAIIKKNGNIEIYTLKDFKAGAIRFAPESYEMKPRHYTAGRSAIVRNTDVSTDRRPMVLDGRVRASPGEDSKSSFALFWVVQRALLADKDALKTVNLDLVYSQLELSAEFEIDEYKIKADGDADDMPSIPVLINPKAIKKHTRLVTKEDADLKKLTEADAKIEAKSSAKKPESTTEPLSKKAKTK